MRPVKLRPGPPGSPATPALESGPSKYVPTQPYNASYVLSLDTDGVTVLLNCLVCMAVISQGERPDHDAWHEGNYSGPVPGS